MKQALPILPPEARRAAISSVPPAGFPFQGAAVKPCIRCKNPEQPMAPGRHICKACLRIDLRMGARQRKRWKKLRPVVTSGGTQQPN